MMAFRPVHFFIFAGLLVTLLALVSEPYTSTETLPFGQKSYRLLPDAFLNVPVSAESYLVFDAGTGDVLASANATERHEMASVVKLLTAETALTVAEIEASTTISLRAVRTDGRAGNLEYGEEYRLRELLFPMLLESSNDAAEAIAEKHGREKFIEAMNERRATLGMASTTVVDPSGLSRQNLTTATDLEKLLAHLYRHHRHILDITTLTTFIGREKSWRNNDPVITSEGFIGGKHGYTDTAGRTLAAIFETRFGDETVRPIGIILLSSGDIRTDVALLREEVSRAVSYGW